MNETALAWNGLFLGVVTVLLTAPLLPAWKEWKHPEDDAAQPLGPQAVSAAKLLVRHFHLTAETPASSTIEATQSIFAMAGSRFEKLVSPRIQFGTADPIHRPAASPVPERPWSVQEHGSRATPWGKHGWRIEGDVRIPASHQITGPLVVTGSLHIEPDCLIAGDIKAHGSVFLAPRTMVTGALMSDQGIDLGTACVVQGPVLCAGDLSIASWVVLGQETQATSVCADNITVQSAAMVHGTVWARRSGQVT